MDNPVKKIEQLVSNFEEDTPQTIREHLILQQMPQLYGHGTKAVSRLFCGPYCVSVPLEEQRNLVWGVLVNEYMTVRKVQDPT